LLAAGAGGDPAAESGVLKGLGKMAEGKSPRTELRLQVRAGHTRFEDGLVALLVELEQAVHPREIHRQDGLRTGEGIDVPHHAGAAAIRNQTNLVAPGKVEEVVDVFVVERAGDPVGEGVDPAAPEGDPVWKALAAGVPQAVFRVRRHQRMRRQSAWRSTSSRVASRGGFPCPTALCRNFAADLGSM
jgi:hypothetical protein